MLLTKEVEVVLAGNSLSYYQSLGYQIPEDKPNGEHYKKIMVDISDVPLKSSVYVEVLCDYCLDKNIENKISKKYSDYNKERVVLAKDCCSQCKKLKQVDVTILKYGVTSTSLIPEIREKQLKSLVDNYGVKNPLKSEIIKNKLKNTNMERYGVEYTSQSNIVQNKRKQNSLVKYGVDHYSKTDEFKKKIKESNLVKYGSEHYFQTKEFKEYLKSFSKQNYGVDTISQSEQIKSKIKKTNLKKYGTESFFNSDYFKNISIEKYEVDNPIKNPEVNYKRNCSFYKNSTIPTSLQQLYLCKLLDGELNYPTQFNNLDIAFPNEKIYIEYDGGGHKLNVLKGNLTDEEFNKKEMIRYYNHRRDGWKMIRIISLNDYLPQDDTILEMFEFAKNYLSLNHSWIKFDIDNSKIIHKQGEHSYDFGNLRKITNDDLKGVNL